MINAARQPVILADVEVHRFGLQELLLELIEKANIPFASTILAEIRDERTTSALSAVSTKVPWAGMMFVRHRRVRADRVIMLGTFMTDINLGIYTARLTPPARSVPPAKSSRFGITPSRTCASGTLCAGSSSPPACAGVRIPIPIPVPEERSHEFRVGTLVPS